jgi:hypothetical protein
MKEKEEKKEGAAGSTTRKVKNLQKQYNKILMDLFTQYAPECIENALDEVEGAFGQNIDSIVAKATEELKTKVLDELGVKGSIEVSVGGAGPMGGFAFGIEGEAEDLEDPEHEASETPEEEEEERVTGVEDEEEGEEKEEEEEEEEKE